MEKPIDLLAGLEFDQQASAYIAHSAKWSRFLAVFWYVIGGLWAISAVIAIITDLDKPKTESGYGELTAMIFMLLWAIAIIVGNVFRWRFASQAIRALRETDQQLLLGSLKQLKLYTKYCGILSIVSVALTITVVLITIFADLER
jgi:hypothetical protein